MSRRSARLREEQGDDDTVMVIMREITRSREATSSCPDSESVEARTTGAISRTRDSTSRTRDAMSRTRGREVITSCPDSKSVEARRLRERDGGGPSAPHNSVDVDDQVVEITEDGTQEAPINVDQSVSEVFTLDRIR